MFSSERAIEQHRAASHNSRCRLEVAQRGFNVAPRSLAGSADEDKVDDGEPVLRRRHRAERRVPGPSPIKETLATLAAFLTTTLQRPGRGE